LIGGSSHHADTWGGTATPLTTASIRSRAISCAVSSSVAWYTGPANNSHAPIRPSHVCIGELYVRPMG
jgi:hypothetical protein